MTGSTETIRTRNYSLWVRALVVLGPLLLNLIVCTLFVLTRPPATSLIEERQRAREAGGFVVSSGDPYMLIAERPLKQWNEWHGGESAWVKVAEILNAPALVVTKRFGDEWLNRREARGLGSHRADSWRRAYLFLFLSSAQWLLVGTLVARLIWRRRTPPARAAAGAPAASHAKR